MKFRTHNKQKGTKVQNDTPKKKWVPYADMGFQNVGIAHGLAKCYIATKEDSDAYTITIRDKGGNIARVSDKEFAEMGGVLRVLRYVKEDGSIVENPNDAVN